MRLIIFFRLLGISKPAAYQSESGNEIDFHHHDSTDGCELLEETVHTNEQPFDETEEDYAANL
jgi:hypothetical protein